MEAGKKKAQEILMGPYEKRLTIEVFLQGFLGGADSPRKEYLPDPP
jgi:hypothetical protein